MTGGLVGCALAGFKLVNALRQGTRRQEGTSVARLTLRQAARAVAGSRRETIAAVWLACHTQQEIADAVGYASKSDISTELAECSKLEALPKSNKLAALHEDAEWAPPLYDIWNVSSNHNSITRVQEAAGPAAGNSARL